LRSVSVIIPTYNRASLIAETLDAVLTQTLRPLEVIVVDDGSTDSTANILAHYAPHVRSVVIPNSGDLVARNTGLRQAQGDLVAFCDSDDLWKPEFLSAMAGLWEAEPALKVAYGNFNIVRNGIWQTTSKFTEIPENFWNGARTIDQDMSVFDIPIVSRLIRFQPFFPSSMVVDCRFFAGIGGWDEGVSRIVGCDFATALLVAEHTPLGVLHRPLVGIRKHAGNLSGDIQKMNLGDARILDHVLRHRPSLAPIAPQIRASIIRRRQDALDTAFERGDLAGVRQIDALLPPEHRSRRGRIKAYVASLPTPVGKAVANLLLVSGTLRDRLTTKSASEHRT
jgi:Glycosyl transferase family 2